ncbi:ClpP/crotonase-like domain-containing protein [Mucor mucedo]|uniref:ClpP/crotonase-like domain-containing protein n=1 Tax=Mucor mucedo TaxID=29922 RepID=UPI002220AF4C|nr:ClpP/crotonase-like domain-containing protein [Mucor mucedo]KAI7888710.1 ClpP/crotonase-like domain-containing protein [Mucor mucedo]
MVILKGNGRAFSSGGDIKFLANAVETPSRRPELDHFVDTLHNMLHFAGTMQTPLVSFMNGITFGTGCGLGVLSQFNVATENTKMAMPETRFGHFCDAGSNFFLSRLNGHMGRYIALTSRTLVAEDTLMAGLASHFVPSHQLESLEDSLINMENPSRAAINKQIEAFAVKADHVPFSNTLHGRHREIIDTCFRFDTVGEILRALEKEGSKFSLDAIDQICDGSPLAIALTLEQLRRAAGMSLAECTKMEYNSWQISPFEPDFCEGIDAKMVRKQTPQWVHQTNSTIDRQKDIIAKYFVGPPVKTLKLASKGDYYTSTQARPYGLPTEEEVRQTMLLNNFRSDGDIISWFVKNRNNKFGVEQEVAEIIKREYRWQENEVVEELRQQAAH